MRWAAPLALVAALCLATPAERAGAQAAPGAPTGISLLAGAGSFTVSWSAPAVDGGSAITSYDLRHIETAATDKADANWTVVDSEWTSGDLSYTLAGLRDSTGYDVQVQAANAHGAGSWSGTSAGTTSDHGDTVSAATAITVGSEVPGRIHAAGDTDHFTFTLDDATYVLLEASTGAGTLSLTPTLYDDHGAEVYLYYLNESGWSVIDDGGLSMYALERLKAGTYTIRIAAAAAGQSGSYLLKPQIAAGQVTDEETCEGYSTAQSDPLYGCQWHLKNTQQYGAGGGGFDINVEQAWATTKGEGINVLVVDSGLDYLHSDLRGYEYESGDPNGDSLGHHDPQGSVRHPTAKHGTWVAGVIAARDNDIGTRGVAPRATVYGYTISRGGTQIFNEARARRAAAASHMADVTAVSSNSWRIATRGTYAAATDEWRNAIESGITSGYGGKGVLYVWLAGNFHASASYANRDEMLVHHGVTVVCAVNYNDVRTTYSERGDNLWLCAPSGDPDRMLPGIATTALHNEYNLSFGGTSAATPIVSGVAALVRAANTALTWRDVKLILAGSARRNDASNTGWEQGALAYGSTTDRYWFNTEYGFGVVDAGAAVELATGWTKLPPFRERSASASPELAIPDRPDGGTAEAASSSVTLGPEVEFVEYASVELRFSHDHRDDIQVDLTSPAGTVSELFPAFESPNHSPGFRRSVTDRTFHFGASKHLGESAEGTWTLRVRDTANGLTGTLHSWTLTVHGHTPGICSRALAVQTPILAATSRTACADVTAADLASVTTLNVTAYGSTSIDPADFAGLTGLTNLQIDASPQLTTVPDNAFADLTALTSLDLNFLSLTTLGEDAFDGLTALDNLNLSNNGLTTLDADIFDGLTALIILALNSNSLTTLDADIFDGLTALEALALNNTRLTTLDADIFDGLTALEALYLNTNLLTTLDEDIFDGLTALEELYLFNNSLTTLHADIFDGLTALNRLELQDNSLTALDADIFEGITALDWLDLGCHFFTELDLDIFDPFAATLTHLSLMSDSFTTPPVETAIRAKFPMIRDVFIAATTCSRVTVSPTSLTVTEGATGTYTVALRAQPLANVAVAISSDNTKVTLSPATPLTFTASDWDTPQMVTVSAAQDTDYADESATLILDPSGGGSNYHFVGSSVLTVVVVDDDEPPVTLVSNAGQGDDHSSTNTIDRSQAFTTSAGATLSSVEIISEDPDGDDVAVSLCTVDGSDHPTSTCTVLTAPPSFAAGTLVFRAPANTTLAANTTYSLLIASPGGEFLLLDATYSDNEDASGATDWSIANTFDVEMSSNTWVARDWALRITIKGTINNAPTVATAIPDRTATTGTAFSYAFPPTTFTDADSDTLTYTATKSDDSALPAWLSFTAATRAFSGTPQAADVETVSVKVTASDGNGESVSDTFDIVVDLPADTSPTLVSNAGQGDDHSSTNTIDRSQAFTTSAGATLSSVEIISEDPDGDDVAVSLCTVDGSDHPTSTCTVLTAPPSFAAGTLVFRAPANTTLAANTTYSLLIASPGGEFLLLDATYSDNEDAGGATDWSIANTFDVEMSSNTWVARDWALRITIKGTINNAPTVATAIPDRTATTGTAFSYAFPPTTFTDADSDTLTYTATLADDSALPAWLSFSAATRTFSGTPTAAETVSVKVTASDGNGGSVNDTFDIVVTRAANNAAMGEPTISGTARVGRTLTASTTGITDADGLTSPTYTYQWIRANGMDADIASANSSTYTLVDADLGKTIKVKVSFTDDASNTETLTSAAYPSSGTVQANNVLVSNVGQTQASIFSLATFDLAQSFRTGANATGYTLTSIELRLDSTNSTNTPAVKLYSGSANGMLKATFTGPAMLDASSVKNYVFTPSSAVILPRSTTYWVVAEGATDWTYTVSTGEDGTSAMGWSIGDYSEYRNEDSTGNFLPDTGNPFLIHVTGTLGGIVLSSDATLSALALEDASDNSAITISPVFASGTTSYTASVVNGVDEITITPTVNESNATVEYLDSSDAAITDADSGKTGQQVSLSVDANTIKVKVTAEDTTTTDTYTVVVTRAAAAPMVTDVDVTSAPDSGDTYGTSEMILFTVTFDQAVMVTGTPEFEFCLGTTATASCDSGPSPPARRRAALSSGSGTTALVFGYTVVAGDVDDNGIWIGDQDRTIKLETGDTIQGTVSRLDAVLTHDEVGAKTGHKVNGASTNNAPTVATEIPNQMATAGTAFSYQVPAATFADADSDTLTYTATLADDTALPAWLSFSATTRTFSGTPTAAETVSVKVTASDASDSVSDTFDIVVSATTGICSRTAGVHVALLSATGRATCSDVTAADLASVTTLNVTAYGSTSIDPADFAGLTGLTSLTIADSPQLATVPDNAFAGLTALTSLDLNFLALTTLGEDAFDGLTALEELDLSDNIIMTLDKDIFADLTALTSLDLNFNRSLAALDADIFYGLTALENLNLAFTNQTALAADIFAGLTALEILGLGQNGLTTLDADIFDGLTALRILGLSGNSLTTLDADIFDGLTTLEELDLPSNFFTTLDADLFVGLTALKKLYLNSNLLTTLDADIFDGLTTLEELDLSSNPLTTLDAELFDGLTALKELKLYQNSLSTLDAELFDGLTALNRLELQDNSLTALDADIFEDITALDWLNLKCNYFTALDLDIFNPFAATLTHLDLMSDSFTTPPSDTAIRAKFPMIMDVLIGVTPCLRVTVSPTSLTVAEGATGTYTVALRAQPLANVMVTISSDNTKVTLSPATPLTFTASDWDTPQMVTVSAALDSDDADESVTLILDPSGSNYDFVSSSALTVVVVDDDDPRVTLVSNAGQGGDTGWTSTADRSQAFTTSAGATLSSVEIISEDLQGDDVAVSLCTVDGSNHPTSTCAALTAPSSFAAGTLVFTAPVNTTLAANTTYSLVVASPGGEGLTLDVTHSDNEDAGGAMGWSIANTFDTETSSDTWVVSDWALRITIKGTINNAPTVATEIPDQTATTGTAFSYQVPAATFTDADSDTLTYTATLADDTGLPSWLSFTAATRTFSGTPTAAGTVSVKVTASDASDSVSDTFDIVVSLPPDTTAPRVASIVRQVPTSSPTNADSLTWRVTFSEAVSNVDAADFAVSGTTATVTAVAAVTGAYDVTASGGDLAGVSATVTLTISSSHNIEDGASNALSNTAPTGTNDNSYVLDNTAPTVTISGVPSASDAPFTATFTFSEAVTGFAVGDITLGNATASSFTATSTTVYTALVTPTASGTVTVAVSANAAQDAVGNGNTAATVATTIYTPPAITIVAGTSPVTEGTPAVFTLSRAGSTTAALTVNVTVSETGGDMVAASNEGARTVAFLANSATATLSVATASDSVDEANSVVTATISADTGSPASYSVGTPASAMVTVEDNDTRDVTVSPTALPVNEGSTGTYTVVLNSQPTASVTVTPSRTGSSDVTFSPATLTFTTSTWNTMQTVTVTAAQDSDVVDDSATISHAVTGGDYAGVTADSVVVTVDDDETADTTAPRVASIVRQVPTSSPTNADSLTWRVTFSEAVSNVDAADFAVSGTTATVTAVAAVSGLTGAYDVTASGGNLAGVSATVGLAIAASHNIQDGASNALSNTAPTGTNDNSYVVDNTAPTVTISGVPSASNAPFTATFTFSEAVTGFAAGDITLGNASASSFTVTSTTVSTALVTPAAAGAVTVDVPANAAQDAAGNGNTAATRASSTYAVPAITIVAGASPVTEGASAVFTLSRAGSTTAALTVNVTVSETGGDMVAASNEGARTVAFLANSATATLSVATASDSVDEANSVVTATISADTGSPAGYSVGTPASAMVTVEDNDTRDVKVSATALPVNEGSTGTYTVVLNSQPTASVTVTPSRTGSSDVTFSPPTLTFTTSTWSMVQTVTVTAAQDSDAVDDSATISHAVTGGDYVGVTVDSVVVTVDDDETADTTAPRVASITRQNPTVSPTNADSLTWRVTFSEAVSNVNAADFAVSGTTATVTAVAVSGLTGAYDVTASGGNLAALNATVTLAIAASHNIEDGASNALSNTTPTGTNDNSYVVDNTAPSVTISGVPASSDAPFRATFTFSEAVTGFAAGDIRLDNASGSSFTVTSTTVYRALVTPTAAGTVTVDVSANAAQDAAGNGNTAATQASSTYSGTVIPAAMLPTVTLRTQSVPESIGTAMLVVTLDQPAGNPLSVPWYTLSGTAMSPGDYTNGEGTLIIPSGVTNATISITIIDDAVEEPTETVLVLLSSGTGYDLGGSGATVSILDDDGDGPAPSGATVDGATVVLTYNEPLDGASTPSSTAFVLRVAGDPVSINEVSVDGSEVTLTLAAPVPAGQTVSLDYTAPMSNPIQDASGNKAQSFTRWYLVTESTITITNPVITVPGAPTALSATAVGNTQINLSWTAPGENGGAPISGYKIESSPDGVANWTELVANTGNANTTYEHLGLTVGTTRHYRVSAINSVGVGRPSNIDDAIASIPSLSLRTQTVLESIGTTVLAVTLDQPAGDPLSVPWYTLSGTAESPDDYTNGEGTLIIPSGVTNATISITIIDDAVEEPTETVLVLLSSGTGYDLGGSGATVSILDDDGDGPAPSGATVDGATVVLTYNEPLDGASTPSSTAFVLRVAGDPVSINEVSVDGSEVTLTLAAPVPAGQTVSLDYTAPMSNPIQDASGNKAQSFTRWYLVTESTITITNPVITVPGAPTALSATAVGNTQINLSWTAPGENGGAPISGYKIESSPDGVANWTELVANTGNANTTYEHLGLTVGTTRHYRVSAINSVGVGRPSNIDDAITGAITVITTGGGGGGGGPSGPSPSEVDFEWNVTRDIEALDGGNDWPTGLWSDGETLWIAENGQGADDEVYAYDRASGERLSEREFELAETNRAPRGFWSDRSVVWVSDSGQERLFAYDLATGERLEEREFALAAGNSDARGIWSDEETMWVLDGRADALFAYDFESGALLAEYALDSANDDPRGIWSDGVTVWVSDDGAKRLIAYRLPAPEGPAPEGPAAEDAEPQDLERVRDEEFPKTVLSRASNNSPRGIWSDGDVMYVADESDDRVYSYNMPDAIDARLVSLTLSGVDIGEFDPRRPDYEAVVADGVTEATVEAEAMQRRTDVAIDPPDADEEADGHQVALQDLGEITITVTSQDGSRMKVYRVQFPEAGWDPARDAWPHCLRGAVSEGFSLIAYEGGSVAELVACAESRHIVAFYALHEGAYAPYILGAPGFVNAGFLELFADGLPPVTPLIAGSNGPPSPDPFGDDLEDGGQHPWPECLRGAVSEGFSLVVYEGGSVEELEACARSMDVTALYTLSEGEFVSYILGGPDFGNQPFRDLFADGPPLMTPLVARSEGPPGGR